MGWGTCGKNSKTGEMMGYCYSGKCNHQGCKEIIPHGLACVCGGMHEGGDLGCGYYFCENHLYCLYFENDNLDEWAIGSQYNSYDRHVCKNCYNEMIDCIIENLTYEEYTVEIVDKLKELEYIK